jgi:hypothetical protein
MIVDVWSDYRTSDVAETKHMFVCRETNESQTHQINRFRDE